MTRIASFVMSEIEDRLEMSHQAALEHSVRQTGVFRCLECGKCTAICPISRYDHHFSPRRTVGRALMRHDQALLSDDRLWACITCLHCSQVCPAGVAYSDLTLAVRTEARKLGQAAVCTHGEAIHSWMRLMLAPGLKQNRLDWLTNGPPAADRRRIPNPQLRISKDSDTLYFVGCAPYFDVQFGHIGVDGSGVARATVQVLNAIGIEPQVLADEVCCGHDLLWEGDENTFRKLAALNATLIRQSGARRIVTSCPECARALKVDYPAHGVKLGVEILHLAELLATVELQTPEYRIPNTEYRITYQDPCRLGRHLGVYDAPRQVIERLGLELVEMSRHREDALCCGTNGWTHCGAANKEIQADRLREAQATGADVLVTACLKCQIHFKCALQDRQFGKELAIEIKDLATLVAERLGEVGSRE
jgi:heterodisulfide reductase subunit D